MKKKLGNLFIAMALLAGIHQTRGSSFVIYPGLDHPSVRAAFDGTNYLVSLQYLSLPNTNSSVGAQLVSPAGSLIGPPILLTAVGDPPFVAFDGNNYLLLWADYSDTANGVPIMGQFIDPQGATTGPTFQIGTDTNVLSVRRVVFGDGNYLVVWADTNGLLGQLVSPGGLNVGADFYIGGTNNEQAGLAFDGTNYLVIWPTPSHGVYGQFVSSSGALVDSQFLIDSNALASGVPSPDALFDGARYIVSVVDGTAPAGSQAWKIFARVVTTSGMVLTDRFTIAADAGDQLAPSGAFDGTNYLFSWNSGLGGKTVNIKGRFFDSALAPLGTEFEVLGSQGVNVPEAPTVLFDGTQYFVTAGLGDFDTNDFSFDNFPGDGIAYGDFIPMVSPPAITSQPTNQTVTEGTLANLSVSASGTSPLTYEWYKNSAKLAASSRISGVTNDTLTIDSVTTNDAGTYFVVVSNFVGGVASSNAVLTVFVPDTTPPTLTITSPTANQRWSNALFTVTGTARDNMGVANVFYSLNDANWAVAETFNQWSNWTAQATLIPGTNTIQACAVDTSGNVSKTNTVKFIYVLNAVLTVTTNGPGSAAPDDNGALLQIGKNYMLTATALAGSGFAFKNWTGGTSLPLSVITNKGTLRFQMVSNLMLQANFVDVEPPVLKITNVVASLQVSNANFAVLGTATDNVAVAGVYCQLNGMGWASPTSFVGRNWSDSVTLNPGTNRFQVYAVDTSGNISTTNTANIVYILSAQLTVSTNGPGSVSPNDNGALLQIGKNYTLTATALAGSGFAFTNWTGGTSLPLSVITNKGTLQFQMVSNLMLQANLVDVEPPVLKITNVVASLQVSNANFVVLGTATDNVAVAGVYCQLNGTGWASPTSFAGRNWSDSVTLNPGTNRFQAYAVDASGNISPTNTVSIVYVLSAPLQIWMIGQGTISPNYSNATLQIGRAYSIAATGKNGYVFTNWLTATNWVGGTSTNNATVHFIMVSNLTLQVTFVDETKPTITMNNPIFGQEGTNEVMTMTGTTSDSNQMNNVINVIYQINGSAWMSATTADNWANWTATVILNGATNTIQPNLVPGKNLITAIAVDSSGIVSVSNHVNFNFNPPVLTLNALPHAQVGQPYNTDCAFYVGSGTGGFPPYYFTLETASGFPPIGIIMDLNGCLSGTASIPGTYQFGVELVDLTGSEDIKTATLVVDPVYTLTLATSGSGTGTVVADPPGFPPGLVYTNGSKVTLTETADAGSTFTGWSGAASGTATSVQVTINGNESVTASFSNPNAAVDGTWNSSQSFNSSDGTCSVDVTAGISLVLSASDGVISGSGTENGLPCFNSDCSIDDYPTLTGSVSGSISGNSISVTFYGIANGGNCDGQEVDSTWTGTLSGNTFSGTTPSGRAFTFTKQ